MKCPSCGERKLVRDTRDVPYTYKGETTTIPAVRGEFCPACGESVLAAAESKRVSPPVQNAFSPAPVRQMTPTSSLLHARLKHVTSSSTVRARKELYRSGRLIVIQARPWSTSYVTSVSWSISRCRPSLAGAVAAKENYPRKRSFSSYRPPSDRE